MARDTLGIPAKFASPANLDIAVVLPTFNERDNIPELIRRLRDVLSGLNWELIFVDDDSPDGTSELIRSIAAADRRIWQHRSGCGACPGGHFVSRAAYRDRLVFMV